MSKTALPAGLRKKLIKLYGQKKGTRVGDPKKDGWYAHLAAYPHQIKNSKKGQSSGETQNHISPMFIEKARLRKRVEVLDRLLVEAKNLINFKK